MDWRIFYNAIVTFFKDNLHFMMFIKKNLSSKLKGGKLNYPNFNAYIMSILFKKGKVAWSFGPKL